MSKSFTQAFVELTARSFIPLLGNWIVRIEKLDHPSLGEDTFEATLFKRTDISNPTWHGPATDPLHRRYFHIDHRNPEATDYTEVSDPKVAIDPADPKVHAMLSYEDGYGWTVTMIRPQPMVTIHQLALMVSECIRLKPFFETLRGRTSFSNRETLDVLHRLDLLGRHEFGVGPAQRALRMRID